jgi:DNA-binding MarR family transcriptional regulator
MANRKRGEVTGGGKVRLGTLDGRIGYALRRAQLAVFADFIASLEGLGLRPVTYSVLEIVAANPGLTQAAVGEALGIQRANLVPLVAELEQQGWLQRMPAAGDRRAMALELTPPGRAQLLVARRRVALHESRVAGRLGRAGRRDLLELLKRLATPRPDDV